MVFKIAITGPESTGKSWMASKLSAYFGWKLVPEYSRIYFEGKEYNYDAHDLDKIAKGQFSLENQALESSESIICDTDILAIKIWSDIVFGNASEYITGLVESNEYDLVILSNLDIPWTPDRFRNNESDRQYIFSLFVNELEKHHIRYVTLEGVGEQRLTNAISLINEFFNGK